MISCPICKGQLEKFWQAPELPATSHQLCRSREDALAVARGVIDFGVCSNCTFVCNRRFDFSLLKYDSDYDNNTGYSEAFKEHLQNVITQIIKRLTRQECLLEIGSGDGQFLTQLIKQLPWEAKGLGFDPAYKGEKGSSNITFLPTVWNGAKQAADVVIARHLIEHLPEPITFLKKVQESVNTNSTFVLETPNSEWIVNNGAFWDLFYEHCSIFNPTSMAALLSTLDINNTEILRVFNDQFILALAQQGGSTNQYKPNFDAYSSFHSLASKKFERLADICDQASGKVGIWGVGAKGVTISNLLPQRFLCGFELNPNKVGKFIPGSGLPIYHADTVAQYDLKLILLMNSNYKEETITRLKMLNCKAEVLEL